MSLILGSTIFDFIVAKSIEKSKSKKNKRILLISSISFNLGLLFIFKYFNFFLESFNQLISIVGFKSNPVLLNIILPVGISFYTFQTLSYTIDVYKGKIKASNDWILFATYVSFFPQLVAGPIERASRMIPQLSRVRKLDINNSREGIRKILLGFFKKVVIADSLSPMVDYTFLNYDELSSFSLLLGAIFFTFQIYCDFSGYSDIAIGVARIFGIKLIENFKYPYFSVNIREFWQRWHISLTTWFRDYLYIPLGGSRSSIMSSTRNILIVFLISGLWHGANWTFIVWGLVHVTLYIPFFIKRRNTVINTKSKTSLIYYRFIGGALTFSVVVLSWVIFRSDSIIDAWNYLFRLFSLTGGFETIISPASNINSLYYIIYILILLMLDLYISKAQEENMLLERTINVTLLLMILFFVQVDQSQSFIYFQF